MNPSQHQVIRAAFERRLTLIQGPPGTGKTSTAVTLVKLWTGTRRAPILVVATSNIAVDNLVSGCVKAGLQVTRVGKTESLRPELGQYSLQEQARTSGRREKAVLKETDIVCCTCSGANQAMFNDMEFAGVVVDEAAQATEVAVLAPLLHLTMYGSVVLVGDHRQLPATVASLESSKEGFATSLFERLASKGVEPFMLDTQYRMHPSLACFPARQYYEGQLLSGICGAARPAPAGIDWPLPETPLAFVNVDGLEFDEGGSFANAKEADAVTDLLANVISRSDVAAAEIGVITPYALQAARLRQRLVVLGCRGVEVSSVDGFQGREKELIIISCVRANATGSIGFTGDKRRLNVMLTRARRGLVVFGHAATLAHDTEGWRPWLNWVEERGLMVGAAASSRQASDALRRLHSLSVDELRAVQL